MPEQAAGVAPEQPRESGQPAIRCNQPPQGSALRPIHPRPATEHQHLAEDEQLQPIVVVDGRRPLPAPRQALAQVLEQRTRRAVRLRMADHNPFVLNVVVGRLTHVGDLAPGEGHQAQPVVVKRGLVGRRERQGVDQQLTAEKHRRPGDRVGECQRGEVRVVVLPYPPVRRLDDLAIGTHHSRVAVDQLGPADGGDEPFELVAAPTVVLVAERH